MKPKLLVGYTLTVLVALWGLVYFPLQCINAVKPYTANPLSALNFDPLIPVVFVPFLMFLAWVVCKLDGRQTTNEVFSIKRASLFAVWLVALGWPWATATARDKFLRDQRTWSGACAITNVFAGGQNQMIVRLKCDNGTTTRTLDAVLVNKLLSGKNVACTLNATGTADCQP